MARHSFYSTSSSSEPSMRDELENTLDGVYPEVPKKQTAILRKMRRTTDGALISCPCVEPLTLEADRDTFCPVCWGEGYLWDENWIDVYKIVIRSDVGLAAKEDLINPGLINVPLVIFYTRSSVSLSEVDKVVELVLDSEGDVATPYVRRDLYRIGTAIDFRSDNGRLEYWKMDCYAEKRKFLNGKMT